MCIKYRAVPSIYEENPYSIKTCNHTNSYDKIWNRYITKKNSVLENQNPQSTDEIYSTFQTKILSSSLYRTAYTCLTENTIFKRKQTLKTPVFIQYCLACFPLNSSVVGYLLSGSDTSHVLSKFNTTKKGKDFFELWKIGYSIVYIIHRKKKRTLTGILYRVN